MPYKEKKDREKHIKQWRKDNSEHVRQYYLDNIERINERRSELKAKKRQYVNNYKLSKGCSVCGYNKCAGALDFHHEGNKEVNISEGISCGISWKRIKEEIKKCDILCANCHRELHAKEEARSGH